MADTSTAAPTKPKQPPGRRRGGKSDRAKKNTSEADVAKLDRDSFDRNVPTTTSSDGGASSGGASIDAPSTPKKRTKTNNRNNSDGGAPLKSPDVSASAAASAQKAARTKPKRTRGAKNAAVSNGLDKQQDGRITPPGQGSVPIPAAKSSKSSNAKHAQISSSAPSAMSAAAFAGNSFHASPLPSALPRPSFLVKGAAGAIPSPDTPRVRPMSGLSVTMQPSPPSSDSELSTSDVATANKLPVFGGESPLDALFKLSREEQSRHQRRSSIANGPNGPPPPTFASPRVDGMPDNAGSQTFPRDHAQQQHFLRRLPANVRSPPNSGGIPSAELDGFLGQPMGPAFSTPFNERLRASRPVDLQGPPNGFNAGHGGGFVGVRDIRPASDGPAQFGGHGNYMLTPPIGAQSPTGAYPGNGVDNEALLKRMRFGPAVQSPPIQVQRTASTPTRPYGPPQFTGYPGSGSGSGPGPAQQHPEHFHGNGILNNQPPPTHMYHQGHGTRFQPPPPAHGPPFYANPSNPNGPAPTHNVNALESSLRNALKLAPATNV